MSNAHDSFRGRDDSALHRRPACLKFLIEESYIYFASCRVRTSCHDVTISIDIAAGYEEERIINTAGREPPR